MRLEDIVRRIIKRGKDSDIIIDDISINQAKKLLHEGYESLLQDDLENAKELYLQVLELDPNDSRALNNLGYILKLVGFKNESLSLFNRVIDLDKDKEYISFSFVSIGKIAYDSGKTEEAEKYYKKALDVNPKNASAYHNSALILSKERNNMKEAEKYYEKALDLYAEDKFKSSLLSDWGFDYLELGDKSRSEKLLRKAIALNPSNSMALSNFGYLRYEQGKNEEAEKLWGEVIRINNSRDALAYAYNNLGYLYKENGKNEDAILNFLSSIEVCPSYKIEYEKVQKLIYKGLQECFEKMGCVRDVISIMKDYFTHNKSKEAGTFVLSLLDYVGDNRAEDEVWQQLVDILKKDSDFANKLISQEKTKNPIKYDMSSPLSGLTYILDTCDPQKNPKQEKERLEKRYKTHKFFYDEFKKIKCQDQIAKPIAFFENESLENGVLGLKRKKKDSYYLMKHTQGARLHELIQNQETTYKDIKAAMSNLVLFHEFSSNAEAGEELNLEDPMDSNPNYYTCRFRDIFLKNLSKSGKNVSHKEEKELLFAYGITINSALQDTNKSIYKDANPKNYLVQDNGNVVALDIESNLKVPRHLDVVSLLEFGGDYLTSHQKNTLIEYHRNALSKIPGEDVSIEENKADYHIAAVQRHFELAGYRLGELAANSNDCIWTRDAAFYHINKGLGYLDLCIHNEYFEDSESLEKVGKTLRQILR